MMLAATETMASSFKAKLFVLPKRLRCSYAVPHAAGICDDEHAHLLVKPEKGKKQREAKKGPRKSYITHSSTPSKGKAMAVPSSQAAKTTASRVFGEARGGTDSEETAIPIHR